MHIARETAGAARTRSSLRPLFSRGMYSVSLRAHRAARTRMYVRSPSLRGAKRRSNPFFARQDRLLRFARNDDNNDKMSPPSQQSRLFLFGLLDQFFADDHVAARHQENHRRGD